MLDGLRHPVAAGGVDNGPAYPPHWLPEVQAAQTPAEWMEDNAPDPHAQRNGNAPAAAPPGDAYPAEWLQGFGGLGTARSGARGS